MRTEIMKLSELKPAPYNPRETLKPGDEEYEALKNCLDKFGLVQPLVMNTATGLLVSGHQRLNVLKAAGVQEAEVVLIDVAPDREKLLNVALNKIDGEWDYEKLKDVFSEFEAEEIKFTGFSRAELNNLFDDGMPDFDEEDPGTAADQDNAEEDGEPDKPEEKGKPAALKEFNIFLSFPGKEAAEKWLADRGVDQKFEGTSHNITIRMEGLEYGTGH